VLIRALLSVAISGGQRQRGAVPVKDIGAALQLDYGTLSPLLKRLEAAGLVRRSRRPDDERSVEIGLTEAGKAMRAKAADVPAKMIRAIDLDDRAVDDLRAALTRLTASVNDGAPTPRRGAGG
jgi:DNA-binding MarR family transcriptional regulator